MNITFKQGTLGLFAAALLILGTASASAATLSSTVAKAACAAPSPGQARCDAELEVSRASLQPVRPQLRASVTAVPAVSVVPASEPAATPEPQAGTPAYLQQAYDLTALANSGGAGDTVAIVDAYDDPSAEADLAVYRAQFGLAACTTANGCFRKVNQNGGSSYPLPDSGWAVEVSLDLDALSALCPNCHILLVEANSASLGDLEAAQAQADTLGAGQISDSWGAALSFNPGGTFTFPGVATVAATGDNGYLGPTNNQYPAALAGVNAAGGTTLQAASTSGLASLRGFSESAWSGAGSGCDSAIAQPVWQAGFACGGRAYADLSAVADPNTGLKIYDSSYTTPGWLQVGGTSEASPLIAAYYAITGAGASSPAWDYSHAALLNDPASGSNGSCSVPLFFICTAKIGYDGPTGAGSISGAVTVGAPGIAGPGTNGSYTQSSTSSSALLAGALYPNGEDTSYFWEYGPSGAYGQQSSLTDVGGGSAAVAVADTLTGLQANTVYHYRLVAENGSGTSYGYDFTLTTSPSASPTVSAASVTAIGATSATLAGTLNAQGQSARYHFSYGLSAGYGQDTPTLSLSGATNTAVGATLSGLSPSTTYHYTLTVNAGASNVSYPDQTFTTAAAPIIPPVITPPVVVPPVVVPPVVTPPVITPPVITPIPVVAAASTVKVGRVALSGRKLSVKVSCVGASTCHLRLRLRVHGRAVAPGPAFSLRAGSSVTIHLRLFHLTVGRRHAQLLVSSEKGGSYRVVITRAVNLPGR